MASNQLEPFRLISQFFWLICLGVSLINYIVARRRIAPGTNSEDAIRYLDWMSFAGAVPWGLMGVGQISGFTPTVWYYFRPQDLNPFVVLWLACVFTETVAYAAWVLFMDGARKLREYELLAAFGWNKKPMSERLIKITAAMGPPFCLLWIWIAAMNNVPLPK